jgi:hypothetical protein
MMKRFTSSLAAACLALVLGAGGAEAASPAQGDFGVFGFDVTFTNQDGTMATQAGSHPFAMTTSLGFNFDEEESPEGRLKDLIVGQIPGLVADTTYPRCPTLQFLLQDKGVPICPPETAVGIVGIAATHPEAWANFPVFNLTPPPGVLLRLGFQVDTVPLLIDIALRPDPPYNAIATVPHTPQALDIFANKLQLWGDPSAPGHDGLRGGCGLNFSAAILPPGEIEAFEFKGQKEASCPVGPNPEPLLTVPTACAEPLPSSYEAFSWEGETALDDGFDAGSRLTHDAAGNPQSFTGCGGLPIFDPSILAQPTTKAAQSPTGLDFSLKVEDEGLTSVTGLAKSTIKKVVATLPEGMSANPSLAEGLEVCSRADLDRETLAAEPGEGCPQASRIGTVEVESPLASAIIKGSLYMAKPYENPFDSLLALYVVLKNRPLGIIVKQAGKIEPDPWTGQLVSTFEDIPQLPFSHFKLHFREGGRSPLISPPHCGTYQAKAQITPWSSGAPFTSTSTFQIISGPSEGPCPPGGIPPFRPGFTAGSINNNAGSYSPFHMRLTRSDGEQDMTKFSSVLPPGVLGKLAGIAKCPNSAIATAKAKTGVAELASPSCPPNSEIGHTLAGAGVGSQLTYVPGKIYLAGPYKGAPLSVVAITSGVAGPFDAGTVVVREALTLNPITAEVEVDGAASDPIPHILKGIPLNVRDLRVYVDRRNFILNPTNCTPSSAKATLFGGFLDVFSPADDVPVGLSTRYQAANCASLPFKPRLKLNLRGGTKRGGHPGLKAVLRARPGDANIGGAKVTLPRSAFLDQAHIRTICTRVQYAQETCPPGSIYGHAKAITPLLDEPIEGNVYLRSSSNKLPDLVIGLKGLVDVDVSSRIDSFKGGIRNTFEVVPDAPVTSFTLTLQGGKKGLIVNSRDLCEGKTSRVNARFTGQNGRAVTLRPQLKPQCGGKK